MEFRSLRANMAGEIIYHGWACAGVGAAGYTDIRITFGILTGHRWISRWKQMWIDVDKLVLLCRIRWKEIDLVSVSPRPRDTDETGQSGIRKRLVGSTFSHNDTGLVSFHHITCSIGRSLPISGHNIHHRSRLNFTPLEFQTHRARR